MTMFGLNVFQWIFLSGIAFVFVLLISAAARQQIRRREALLYSLVLLAAAVAIYWPPITSRVAGWLGIGRGADLLLYLAIVGMFVGFWMVYVRLLQLRREMTQLVRHHAIEQTMAARGNADAGKSSSPAASE